MSSSSLPPHLDPRGKQRGRSQPTSGPPTSGRPQGGRPTSGRPRRRSGLVRPIGRLVGALFSIALLVMAGYYWTTFQAINNGVPRLAGLQVDAPPSGNGDIDGQDQNILLVGNDDRTNMTNAEVKQLKVGRDGGSMATDTMIILHVPADGSKATLISLPRDSYVNIPGHGSDRLNAAYIDGYDSAHGSHEKRQTAGANLLITTIQNLTGLTIDHYVQVSLLGFYEISKAIGGVPINLCHSVNDTVAYNRAHGEDGGSGFHMSKGHHVIEGVTALEFVRQRHNLPLGDLDRVRRQQYFLTAAFRQVASAGILLKLNALGDAIKRNLILDPHLSLIDLAHQMENLTANNIVGKTIPTTNATINGMSVLAVHPAKVQAFVDKVINGPTTSPSSSHKAHHHKPKKALDAKCIN